MKKYCLPLICIAMLNMSFEARAKCANPVTKENLTNAKSWSELSTLEASPALSRDIDGALLIDAATGEKVNYDYYSVTIDAVSGKGIDEFFQEFRIGLTKLFKGSKNYRLHPYSNAHVSKWQSDSPKGTLMTFILTGYSQTKVEKGDVVVSCHDETSFVLSTVRTRKNGFHPLSGNRGFGVIDNHDGSWTIFFKSISRLSPYFGNDVVAESEGDPDIVFKKEHNIWLRLVSSIESKYAAQKPRNKLLHSKRYPYPR